MTTTYLQVGNVSICSARKSHKQNRNCPFTPEVCNLATFNALLLLFQNRPGVFYHKTFFTSSLHSNNLQRFLLCRECWNSETGRLAKVSTWTWATSGHPSSWTSPSLCSNPPQVESWDPRTKQLWQFSPTKVTFCSLCLGVTDQWRFLGYRKIFRELYWST